MYLQTILNRSDEELTKRVYNAQKKNPLEGDWVKMVEKDFEVLGLRINESEILNCTKSQYKSVVKRKLRDHMFSELKRVQSDHSKIKIIEYKNF